MQCRRPRFDSWVEKVPWRRDKLLTTVVLGFPYGFPCGLAGKESACNAGDLGSFAGLGRSPGKRKGYPLQYSGLQNSMDYIFHGATKSETQLSNFHFYHHTCILTIVFSSYYSFYFLQITLYTASRIFLISFLIWTFLCVSFLFFKKGSLFL